MVLRKFPVYSFLSRKHGVKGKKKKKEFASFFCMRDVSTPCAELSRFLPETAILGFSIINLVILDIASSVRSVASSQCWQCWTALYVRYSYYREEQSIDRTSRRTWSHGRKTVHSFVRKIALFIISSSTIMEVCNLYISLVKYFPIFSRYWSTNRMLRTE